jgi:hypothetical protein
MSVLGYFSQIFIGPEGCCLRWDMGQYLVLFPLLLCFYLTFFRFARLGRINVAMALPDGKLLDCRVGSVALLTDAA